MAESRASSENANFKSNRDSVSVLLPYPLGPYDYIAPADMAIVEGDYVRVPLGSREVTGVVWGAGKGDVAAKKLKPVAGKFDVPPMPPDHRTWIDWVAAYTLSAPGAVLRMSLTAPKALDPARGSIAFRRGALLDGPLMTKARQRVLDAVDARGTATGQELAEAAGCSVAVVRGLADAGALETVLLPPHYPASAFAPTGDTPSLSLDQAMAFISRHTPRG